MYKDYSVQLVTLVFIKVKNFIDIWNCKLDCNFPGCFLEPIMLSKKMILCYFFVKLPSWRHDGGKLQKSLHKLFSLESSYLIHTTFEKLLVNSNPHHFHEIILYIPLHSVKTSEICFNGFFSQKIPWNQLFHKSIVLYQIDFTKYLQVREWISIFNHCAQTCIIWHKLSKTRLRICNFFCKYEIDFLNGIRIFA